MAGASMEIRIDDAAVRGALDEIRDRAIDMAPAMDEIGAAMVTATQLRFERGAGPGNIPWKPSIRALAEGGQTLLDTGRLRDSVTHIFGPGFVEWGTNVIYAAIHQFGGQAGRRKLVTIPERAYLGVDDTDRSMITEILTGFVGEAIP